MRLISLKKRKPKKGEHYILFSYSPSLDEWNCGGVYTQETKAWQKCDATWTHWVPFTPPHNRESRG